jgi:hypothetical protein
MRLSFIFTRVAASDAAPARIMTRPGLRRCA